MSGGATRTVVLDASVVINLIHAGRLDLLGKIAGYEFVVPEQAIALEVTYPDQARALSAALEAGWVRGVESTCPSLKNTTPSSSNAVRTCSGAGQ